MDKLNQAIALRNEIEDLKEKQHQLETELHQLQSKCQPKSKYGKMKIECKIKQGMETLYITDYLLNKDEKDQHIEIFGNMSYGGNDWKEQRNSVGYYRNEDGILVHEGGGWLLLEDCRLCSDEEWEQIKSGNIPDKFINKEIN